MKLPPFTPWAALLALIALASSVVAQTVTLGVADDGLHTKLGAGTNPIANKNGLEPYSFYSADPVDNTGQIMGLGNSAERMGMFWWNYSDIVASSTLPATLQAGTYTFELRVGGDGTSFNSPVGGIDLTGADLTPNTDAGLIAGFFSTFETGSTGATAAARTNAEASKDHMYTEFNNLTGVTYIPPTEAAPPTGTGTNGTGEGWTIWTFTWEIEAGSPVIGTDPRFAIYTKVDPSADPGSGAWYDDSTLNFDPEVGSPFVDTFTANLTEISSGDPVTLSWTTSNATTVTLDQGVGTVAANDSVVVNPTTTTTYTLTASDGVDSHSRQIEILVGPRINALTADSATAFSDDPVTLTWDVQNAESLTLNPGGIDVSNSSSTVVNPPVTTTYTLTATNDGVSVMETIDITVTPEIVTFAADSTAVSSGTSVTLSWEVEDATSLTLTTDTPPSNQDVFGQTSLVVNPTETTTYTLTAEDGVSTIVQMLTVAVVPELPVIVPGATISVNFHAADVDALADHEITTGETAGFIPVDGAFWNNINIGAPQAHDLEAIFESTNLIDTTGSTVGNIVPSVDSTYFVGYAKSRASAAAELDLPGNDDDLFNSYLAMNGPNGNQDPLDVGVLNISGLSSAYTSGGYTLIIYSDSDRRNDSQNNRQSLFTVTPDGGTPITAFVEDDDPAVIPNVFDGNYIFSDYEDDGPGYSNFVIFEDLTAASFSLEVSSPDGGRGAISGFQIVAEGGGKPVFTNIDVAEDNFSATLTWRSKPNTLYSLDVSTDLKIWDEVSDDISATGEETTFTTRTYADIQQPAVAPTRVFFRAREQ